MNNIVKAQTKKLDDALFYINVQKMNSIQKEEALSKLHHYEFAQKENFLGFQVNQNIDYKTHYSDYLNISLNNVGDPFTDGNLTTQTKMVEREVLKYFANDLIDNFIDDLGRSGYFLKAIK